MSMPVDLFNKVGTVTCVMVFKANIPHNKDKTNMVWLLA